MPGSSSYASTPDEPENETDDEHGDPDPDEELGGLDGDSEHEEDDADDENEKPGGHGCAFRPGPQW